MNRNLKYYLQFVRRVSGSNPPVSEQLFTKERLAKFTRPCVYLFVQRDRILYAGMSRHGIFRFANKNHHMAKAREEANEILVFWFDSEEHAAAVERAVIHHWKPRYNAGSPERHGALELQRHVAECQRVLEARNQLTTRP